MKLVARLAAVVAATICSIASAGVIPPPWHQPTNPGGPDFSSPQTQQLWTFSQGGDPRFPDNFNNPNGQPTLDPDGSPYSPFNPYSTASDGGWLVGGPSTLTFLIPNFNQLVRKDIWIVIKFSMPPEGAGVPVVNILGTDGSPGTQVNSPTPTPIGPGLSEIAYLFTMPTCWTFNMTISVPVGIPGAATFIDQVYVATRCIPAPGACALLGLAGLVAGRRRR